MKNRPLEVILLDGPQNPMGLLFYVWEQSRTNNDIPHPRMIEKILKSDWHEVLASEDMGKALLLLGAEMDPNLPGTRVLVQPTRERVQKVLDQIFDEDIPCTENLNFSFAFKNMSISLREQMVRHRIGVTVGERTGIDIVPDLSKSTWWSQTMRMLPMDKFYDDGRFLIPDSLKGKVCIDESQGPEFSHMAADELYDDLMRQIEFVYGKLIAAGVPMEDARQIIPIGATHGITWTLNLKAMAHILGKRACWVAQANLWEILIAGMVDELCTHVHPRFRKLILPPCFKKGRYNTCPYFQINTERVQGRDHMPPCPLYVYHETALAVQASKMSIHDTGTEATWKPTQAAGFDLGDITNWNSSQPIERQMLQDNIERFERLWKLNVMTGEPLVSIADDMADINSPHR